MNKSKNIEKLKNINIITRLINKNKNIVKLKKIIKNNMKKT